MILFMELPNGLSEHEYIVRLCELRDEALIRSRTLGNIGRPTSWPVEVARANWLTEDDSIAELTHRRVRLLGAPVLKLFKTTLVFVEPIAEADAKVEKQFEMDLDNSGRIDSFTRTISKDFILEMYSKNKARKLERKAGLNVPNKEELELIYTEMKRGASGMYPVYRPQQKD